MYVISITNSCFVGEYETQTVSQAHAVNEVSEKRYQSVKSRSPSYFYLYNPFSLVLSSQERGGGCWVDEEQKQAHCAKSIYATLLDMPNIVLEFF